ncbi:MAG: TlpA family protein disulfide reductase [Hyphomicrobiaceae bacterium]|nr:TlpA family protein disulfide reductase [Hyphomicrobiaceae bacterium]
MKWPGGNGPGGNGGGVTPPHTQGGEMAAFVKKSPPEAVVPIKFEDGEGKALTLDAFKGKVVLLNLWATWCAPCRKEMPALDRLQGQVGGADFEVVALSVDRAGAKAGQKFLTETGVKNLKLYADATARMGSELRAVGLPTTLLLDRQGREIGRLVGPAEWDSAEAVALVKAAVSGK